MEQIKTDVDLTRAYVATSARGSGFDELSRALENAGETAVRFQQKVADQVDEEFAARLDADPKLNADDLAKEDWRYRMIPTRMRQKLADKRDADAAFNIFAADAVRELAAFEESGDPAAVEQFLNERREKYLSDNPDLFEDGDKLAVFDAKFVGLRQNRFENAVSSIDEAVAQKSQEALAISIGTAAELDAATGNLVFSGFRDSLRANLQADEKIDPKRAAQNRAVMVDEIRSRATSMGASGLEMLKVAADEMPQGGKERLALLTARRELESQLYTDDSRKRTLREQERKDSRDEMFRQLRTLVNAGKGSSPEARQLQSQILELSKVSEINSTEKAFKTLFGTDSSARPSKPNWARRAEYGRLLRAGLIPWEAVEADQTLAGQDLDALAKIQKKSIATMPLVKTALSNTKEALRDLAAAEGSRAKYTISDIPQIMEYLTQSLEVWGESDEAKEAIVQGDNLAILRKTEELRATVMESYGAAVQAFNKVEQTTLKRGDGAANLSVLVDRNRVIGEQMHKVLDKMQAEVETERERNDAGMLPETSPYGVVPH